jgi:hypothetical protein
LQQPALPQTQEVAASHNQVIEYIDFNLLSRLNQRAGDADVIGRRARISRGMIILYSDFLIRRENDLALLARLRQFKNHFQPGFRMVEVQCTEIG